MGLLSATEYTFYALLWHILEVTLMASEVTLGIAVNLYHRVHLPQAAEEKLGKGKQDMYCVSNTLPCSLLGP